MTNISSAHTLQEFNNLLLEQTYEKISELNQRYETHPTFSSSEYLLRSTIEDIKTMIISFCENKNIKLSSSDIQVEVIDREQFQADLAIKITTLIKLLGKEYSQNFLPELKEVLLTNREIESIEIKGIYPNLTLKTPKLIQAVEQILKTGIRYGETNDHHGQVVVAEYSSPNAAKHLHAGHIRSTVIGHILATIYSKTGYRVHRLNHINDWGGFGELIEGFTRWSELFSNKGFVDNGLNFQIYSIYRQAEKAFNGGKTEIDDNLKEYFNFSNYEEFKKAYTDFKNVSAQRFRDLEQGGEAEFQIWKIIVTNSLKDFDQFYNILNIKHDYVIGESFYEQRGKALVEEGLKNHTILHFTQEDADQYYKNYLIQYPDASEAVQQKKKEEIYSDIGSYVGLLNNFERYVVLRSDGASIYSTRDLGSLAFRCTTWRPKILTYEVGQEQADHFNKLFETGEKLGFKENREFLFISHGFYVNKETKKKLSSREGASSVIDLIQSTINYFQDKYQSTTEFSESEVQHIAQTLGKASIIINDIRKGRMDPVYMDADLQKTIEGFEESGGAYLMYTLCRAKSLVAKANDNPVSSDLETIQIDFMKKLLTFPEIVQRAVKFNEPSIIIDYFYSLTQKFNTIYATRKNMTGNESDMLLTKGFIVIAENIFRICNIEPLDRM